MNQREYRRGYMEAWLLGINTLYDLVQQHGLDLEEAYQICYQHRIKLYAWYGQEVERANLNPPPIELEALHHHNGAAKRG